MPSLSAQDKITICRQNQDRLTNNDFKIINLCQGQLDDGKALTPLMIEELDKLYQKATQGR